MLDPTSPRLSPVVGTTGLGRVSRVSDETDLMGAADGRGDHDDDREAADQAAEIEAAMAEARSRLADVPAEVVVSNHVSLRKMSELLLVSPGTRFTAELTNAT